MRINRKFISTITQQCSFFTFKFFLTQVLRVGGSGHKVLLLLEGVASAYVFASKGTKKWDTCAPEALLHAVGGRMTDILGRELPYDANARHGNNEGLFATARAEDHAKLQVKLPEEVLSQFRN